MKSKKSFVSFILLATIIFNQSIFLYAKAGQGGGKTESKGVSSEDTENTRNEEGTQDVANTTICTKKLNRNNESVKENCSGQLIWKQSNIESGGFSCVANAGGTWVACSNYGHGLYYSGDGINWHQSNIGNDTFLCIEGSNKIWVAGGYCGICYSTDDGRSWAHKNDLNGSFSSIAKGKKRWIACDWNNSGVYRSNNEEPMNWNKFRAIKGNSFCHIKYNYGTWIACGKDRGIYYSKNGKKWMRSNITNGKFRYIAYDKSKKVLVACGNDNNGLYYSKDDAKTWTQSNITKNIFYCATCANGIWVAGSNDGIYYSVDGSEWIQISDLKGMSFYCITKVDNGPWIAGSNNGLYYSESGQGAWMKSNISTGTFRCVVHSDGIVVATSYDGNGIYYLIIPNYRKDETAVDEPEEVFSEEESEDDDTDEPEDIEIIKSIMDKYSGTNAQDCIINNIPGF